MRNVVLLILFVVSCSIEQSNSYTTLRKSVTWMWQQQSPDGGWHSKTHAVLRDGKVLTPYIIYFLLQVPEQIYQRENDAVARAAEFIINGMRNAIDSSGQIQSDYPNYSAAYALRVLHLLDREKELQDIIAEYLLKQQFTETRGFTKEHLAYGGWGYGEPGLASGDHGHVDLSHTRRITEALVEAGYLTKANQQIWLSIGLFLKGVQRSPDDERLYTGCISRKYLPYDGGFISSAVTLATNKSEPEFIRDAGDHYPSYATATCDGLMTLHSLGLEGSPAYKDAVNWLSIHSDVRNIEGLPDDDPEQWNDVMHYYHLAVRSEAMTLAAPEGRWREEISAILSKEQHPEGYYINPIGGVNKEDDPLMATILAIGAGINTLPLTGFVQK